MPEGSSSAAPVMRPGPSAGRKRATNVRRRGSTGDTVCPGAASTTTATSLPSISSRYCATLATRSSFFRNRARGGGLKQLPSIYFDPVNALESIRFDTCARIEAEQQNGQRADDYDRSYHCTRTLFVCELRAMAREWDFFLTRMN